ncbi:uncharacterized protein [Haliotis asinina]|uniref:uncharacterized protein n=1 Tax=Haliotis asinina TaxID=109174 RepID=UPI0035320E34
MFCRGVCSAMVEKNGLDRIEGVGLTVEIDRNKFGKRKYHRSRMVEGQMVLGCICRETRHFFLVPQKDYLYLVPNPNNVVCTNLIENQWWCIKRQLPTTHTRRHYFALHVAEYMYRCSAEKHCRGHWLRLLGRPVEVRCTFLQYS